MTETQTVGSNSDKYKTGSLIYTPSGLIVLFSWLLWGDFMFTLMENILPSLLPILLKSHGASNKMIALIATTISMIANSILNPIVSYRSDRYRSKWGRRRPFILWTTPGVVIFLACIPYAPEIANWLLTIKSFAFLFKFSPIAPMFIMFAVLVAGFQIFNMFVSSVYYYLIPDVVPDAFIGRFFGMFRMFGVLAGFVYQYFIFGQAEHYMKEIYVCVAVLYGIAITTMCLGVKEGEYPDPAPEKKGSLWAAIQNYGRQCFNHRYYWWVFAVYTIGMFSGAANSFNVFFYRDELGLKLFEIGKLKGIGNLVNVGLTYPMGWVIDRWSIQKCYMFSMAGCIICGFISFFVVQDKTTAYIMWIINSIPGSLMSLSANKWYIDSVPLERYGQFGSAGALVSSIGMMAVAPLCGWVFDLIKIYRYWYIWSSGLLCIALFCQYIVYRYWQKPSFKAPML